MMGTDPFLWIGIGIADPILFPILHSLSDPLPIPIPILACVESDPDPGSPIAGSRSCSPLTIVNEIAQQTVIAA